MKRKVLGRFVLVGGVMVALSGAAWGWAAVHGQRAASNSARSRRHPRPRHAPREDAVTRRVRDDLLARRGEFKVDRDHDFALASTFATEDVKFHRFRQRYRGLPVLGGSMVVETDAGGATKFTHDRLQKNLKIDVTPRVPQAAAEATARKDMRAPESFVSKAELAIQTDWADGDGIERRAAGHRLVWRVRLGPPDRRSGPRAFEYRIDAHDGSIVHKRPLFSGVRGVGHSQYSGAQVPLIVTGPVDDGDCGLAFQMIDESRSGNTIMIEYSNEIVGDANNDWGNQQGVDPKNRLDARKASSDCAKRFFDARAQTAAVDALHGLNVTWDMYKNVFHLLGWDGCGDQVDIMVHSQEITGYGSEWLGDPFIILADGNTATPQTSIDIVAHEFTHGVDEHLAERPELLKEGTADIFGVLARLYWNNGDRRAGFLKGSDTLPASDDFNDFIIGLQNNKPSLHRNLFRPSSNSSPAPDEVLSNIGKLDVHDSGQPLARAFFFVSQGASAHVDFMTRPDSKHTFESHTERLTWGMPGIGTQRAGRIFFRAMFGCAPEWYRETRVCAVQSASRPDGVEAVENAFAGIAVGDKHHSYPEDPGIQVEAESKQPRTTNDARAQAQDLKFTDPPKPPFEQVFKAWVQGITNSKKDKDWYKFDVKCGRKLGLAWEELPGLEHVVTLFEDGSNHALGKTAKTGLHRQIAFDPTTDPAANATKTCGKDDRVNLFVRVTSSKVAAGPYVLKIDAF